MHDTDPYRHHSPEETLDGPSRIVGPVVPESALSGSAFKRLAVIPFLVLALFAVWATINLRMDREDRERVTYVEQTLNPDDSIRRFEAPPLLVKERAKQSQGLETAAEAKYPFPAEVANVDLTSSADDDRAPVASSSPYILPLNLDYSRQAVKAMSETDLKRALNALDADLENLESLAARTQQKVGYQVLEERFDGLDDLARAVKSPVPQEQLLDLTRQIMELRDEVDAFQSELESVALAG